MKNKAQENLGSAYQHMEAVANSVVYRTHKADKEPKNMRLASRVRDAEAAFGEATMELQRAFKAVFEDAGMENGKASVLAKEAADSAACFLRTRAWGELKANA